MLVDLGFVFSPYPKVKAQVFASSEKQSRSLNLGKSRNSHFHDIYCLWLVFSPTRRNLMAAGVDLCGTVKTPTTGHQIQKPENL
jgi:hypothetical protein